MVVGRKEVQRGKSVPSRKEGVFEKLRSVLKAQNGINAELKLDVK